MMNHFNSKEYELQDLNSIPSSDSIVSSNRNINQRTYTLDPPKKRVQFPFNFDGNFRFAFLRKTFFLNFFKKIN